MMNKINKFFKRESGATAIEYGLIAALIAVVIITATQMLGTQTATKFGEVAKGIKAATPQAVK